MCLNFEPIEVGPRRWHYSVWGGEILSGHTIAFDTETAPIDGHEVPPLALATACDGRDAVVVRPEDIDDFVSVHAGREWVGHNLAFDFEVIAQHLIFWGYSELGSLSDWDRIVESGRAHDTMWLDALIRIARRDDHPSPRNLGLVAAEYAGCQVDKSDPFRMRYAELIGADWSKADPGFFSYAIKDAIATRLAWNGLKATAAELAEAHRAPMEWGLLGETLQLKAAIALAAIERRGFALDPTQVDTVKSGLQARLVELVARVDKLCPGLFTRDRKTGLIKVQAKSGAPCKSSKRLSGYLEAIGDGLAEELGRRWQTPKTAKGQVSTSTKEWAELSAWDPFVAAWCELEEVSKTLQFFGGMTGDAVHPRYSVLVRSGRTSASKPNIQQIPRRGGLREAFVARPGKTLVITDYSFIELRTLAAVCEARYGYSTLGDAIRAGVDPHVYTAAAFEGMSVEDFKARAGSEWFKDRRQAAKALNFGVPGGLGAASLVTYAKSTYGVDMAIEDAREFRRKLIEDTYPELSEYLSDDPMATLAESLGCKPDDCRKRFGAEDWAPFVVRKIVYGEPFKRSGEPYSEWVVGRTWDGLIDLCQDFDLRQMIATRQGSPALARRLFSTAVVTLTGRVRSRASFAQARNTPFQGLAADGAKLALWRLYREGFDVVAFVHDEVVVEVPEDRAEHAREDIERIMVEEMERLTGRVPVGVESKISKKWSK